MIVVLGVLFEHSVPPHLHGTVLTHPYISVSLQSPSFQWLGKEVIVKSLGVLYIPWRMHGSVNGALCECRS